MAQYARNDAIAISATSTEIMHQVPPGFVRLDFTLVQTTAGVVASISKGDQTAVANTGTVLSANQVYAQSATDTISCWQGPVQAIGNGAGSIAVSETLVSRD